MALKLFATLGQQILDKLKPASPAPWDGPQEDLKPLIQAGDVQVPAHFCKHIWMGDKCARCAAPRPPKDGSTLPITIKKTIAPTPLPAPPVVKAAAPKKPLSKKPVAWVGTPWPDNKPYTIIDAIQEQLDGRPGTLMLVKMQTGEGFKVEKVKYVAEDTAHVELSSANGLAFSPKVGAREIAQYSPMWR